MSWEVEALTGCGFFVGKTQRFTSYAHLKVTDFGENGPQSYRGDC